MKRNFPPLQFIQEFMDLRFKTPALQKLTEEANSRLKTEISTEGLNWNRAWKQEGE